MHSDNIVLDPLGNLSHRQGRGVCGEDGLCLTNLVQLGEQALLHVHGLQNSLNHQVGICQVLVLTGLQVSLHLCGFIGINLSLANKLVQSSTNLIDSALGPLKLNVTYSNKITSRSKCICNALSHGSCTNYTNLSHNYTSL